MSGRLKQTAGRIALILVAALAAGQLIRPSRTNPPVDSRRTIQARAGISTELIAVLDRACRDCHSNQTVSPWYTGIAPLSWVWAKAVRGGRQVLNFSEWGAYSAEDQYALLDASCQDASQGKMPMEPYVRLHPDARLSAHDVQTICGAARQADPRGGKP